MKGRTCGVAARFPGSCEQLASGPELRMALAEPESDVGSARQCAGRAGLPSVDRATRATTRAWTRRWLQPPYRGRGRNHAAEGLKIGFEISEAAQSLVQLRRPLAPPRGEARSDLQIIFALATRLGLGEHFWNGDLDAAFRHQLAPSGVTLEQLRAEPAGVRVPLATRYHKYAELNGGAPRGFRTPSRKIELYSEVLADHGYPPLPEFEEPRTSPRSRPELAERFPLILTCAKSLWFCESQHRNLASLRRRVRDPQVELHPDAARSRGIAAGDWVRLETPHGSVRARARFNVNCPGIGLCWRIQAAGRGWASRASREVQPPVVAAPVSHASTRTTLRASAVSTCCRWVLGRPR
jgi:anaerobic selenocysteine-containing dehydrogenase